MVPDVEIAGIAAAHAALDRTVERLGQSDLARPSLLPDWTIGHVLAHIARNADSVVRRLQGSIEGRVVDQYAGGVAGRAAEIEESARLPLAELTAYIRSSSAQVERICAAMPDDAWVRASRSISGNEQPAHVVAYSRWREVEIHLVDLGVGYTHADWPDALVARMLPEVLEQLPKRADQRSLLAWTIGRADAPDLAPW